MGSVTDLQIRQVDFGFDATVPFCWLPSNPRFAMMTNAISVIAITFERFIVRATTAALPLITDPAAAAEATAFLTQEAQHSKNHRRHVRGLIAQYPGLQQTVDEANAAFERITETEPLEFQLAYVADLEATFTPLFKVMLDHDDAFFRPGEERVASLLIWHFVEEVEHRSSALVVYDAVVQDPYYRTRQVRKVFGHVMDVYRGIVEGFMEHVPEADRRATYAQMSPAAMRTEEIRARLPVPAGWKRRNGPDTPTAFAPASNRELAMMFYRLLKSQVPHHQPAHEPLPRLADQWFAAWQAGRDITRYYTGGVRQAG